ncbi:MAG: hypothetical protein ABI333_15910 [bacterium]
MTARPNRFRRRLLWALLWAGAAAVLFLLAHGLQLLSKLQFDTLAR